MIAILTPIHKEEFLQNALSNFNRQKHKDKILFLILNGELQGYYPTINQNNISFIHSASSNIAYLRNIGLDFCYNNQIRQYSFFDSDDWYGEDYLDLMINKLNEGYDIVGMRDYHFKHGQDLYRAENIYHNNLVHGPTMTGNLLDIRFDERFDSLAEDVDFVQRHKNVGAVKLSDQWVYSVREDSIQQRSFESFIEQIKTVNSFKQNKDCTIYKNNKVIWKYGDKFSIEKIFNR